MNGIIILHEYIIFFISFCDTSLFSWIDIATNQQLIFQPWWFLIVELILTLRFKRYFLKLKFILALRLKWCKYFQFGFLLLINTLGCIWIRNSINNLHFLFIFLHSGCINLLNLNDSLAFLTMPCQIGFILRNSTLNALTHFERIVHSTCDFMDQPLVNAIVALGNLLITVLARDFFCLNYIIHWSAN